MARVWSRERRRAKERRVLRIWSLVRRSKLKSEEMRERESKRYQISNQKTNM